MTHAESLKYIETLDAYLEGDALSKLEPLTEADAALIGHLLQSFNFLEFNLRRSIEIFVHAGLITASKKNPHSSELAQTVKTGVAAMGLDVATASVIYQKLDDIELHRDIRNHLAHWAAKRIKGHDALYLMSFDQKDAIRRTGSKGDHKTNIYCILNLADLRGLMLHISKQDVWLADLAAQWFIKYAV
ncbi:MULTISPECIES: hypothetical protein [unclassified Pseudomonas]|uniref:hypothetical protein n=1 Tax=unclassified Pseudomonas TaxID=196821 RepID=UPI001CBEF5F1|nr:MULTISPECIES: hypothetical protein [unclassified Pseudomonas]